MPSSHVQVLCFPAFQGTTHKGRLYSSHIVTGTYSTEKILVTTGKNFGSATQVHLWPINLTFCESASLAQQSHPFLTTYAVLLLSFDNGPCTAEATVLAPPEAFLDEYAYSTRKSNSRYDDLQAEVAEVAMFMTVLTNTQPCGADQ